MSATDKVADKAKEIKAELPDAKQASKTVWQTIKPFANGGLSGMGATCIIQPVDMVKVRIQLGATGSPVSFYRLSEQSLAYHVLISCALMHIGLAYSSNYIADRSFRIRPSQFLGL